MGREKVVHLEKYKKVTPRKKRRLKKSISRFFFYSIALSVVLVMLYLSSPLSKLSMIYFNGLKYLSRSDVMTLIELDEKQPLYSIKFDEISTQIQEHPLVEEVKVEKVGLNQLEIDIKEKNVLGCILKEDGYDYLLNDGTLVDTSYLQTATCHGLVIYGFETDDDLASLSLFVNAITNVDPVIVNLMKEVQYEPNYGDLNRFSIYLLDGNTVKVNSYSMVEKLKYYPTMAKKVEELHGNLLGIYHLDVGDNFEPYDKDHVDNEV